MLTLAYRFAGLAFEEFAPCCAHNFHAEGVEIPHLQGVKRFARRTRRRAKQINILFRRVRRNSTRFFNRLRVRQAKACRTLCAQIKRRRRKRRLELLDEFVDGLTQIVQRLLVVVLHGVHKTVLDVILQNDLADVVDGGAHGGDLD